MSNSYVVKKLLELNEKIKEVSPEEAVELIKEYQEENKQLDVNSPEFLRET